MVLQLLSEKKLREKYFLLNDLFFNGSLPSDVTITWEKRLTRAAGNCRISSKHIKLSPHYFKKFPEDVTSVLLHEMIHLSGVRGHGRAFKDEMERINGIIGKEVVTRYSRERALIK